MSCNSTRVHLTCILPLFCPIFRHLDKKRSVWSWNLSSLHSSTSIGTSIAPWTHLCALAQAYTRKTNAETRQIITCEPLFCVPCWIMYQTCIFALHIDKFACGQTPFSWLQVEWNLRWKSFLLYRLIEFFGSVMHSTALDLYKFQVLLFDLISLSLIKNEQHQKKIQCSTDAHKRNQPFTYLPIFAPIFLLLLWNTTVKL